jgi:2-dehydropantoate 2-reductase
MKIMIMGSGGVGGYFGARLAAAGSDVTFIARGAHLAAIRDHGLQVESLLGNTEVRPAKVTGDPAGVGTADVIFLAVKLWDTEDAVRRIRPAVGPQTAVISFQNGVLKDDVLRSVLGSAPVMGGVAYIGATIARPGVVRQTGAMQKLLFGEYDGKRSARAEALLDACKRAGIDASISDDIERSIWEKFVFIVGLSAATSAVRLPVGPIRSHPQTRALLLEVMREVVAVGRAGGVRLDPSFADSRLAFCDTLPADMTASMHTDLERGNRLELRWLSGAVVELGEKRGVPTPANRILNDVLVLHAEGKAPVDRAGVSAR